MTTWDPQYTDPPLPPPQWPPVQNGNPLPDGQTHFGPMTPTGEDGGFLGNPFFDWEPLPLEVPGMPPPPNYPSRTPISGQGTPPSPSESGNSGLAADAARAERVRNEA